MRASPPRLWQLYETILQHGENTDLQQFVRGSTIVAIPKASCIANVAALTRTGAKAAIERERERVGAALGPPDPIRIQIKTKVISGSPAFGPPSGSPPSRERKRDSCCSDAAATHRRGRRPRPSPSRGPASLCAGARSLEPGIPGGLKTPRLQKSGSSPKTGDVRI